LTKIISRTSPAMLTMVWPAPTTNLPIAPCGRFDVPHKPLDKRTIVPLPSNIDLRPSIQRLSPRAHDVLTDACLDQALT
jgi:hypothetical protein